MKIYVAYYKSGPRPMGVPGYESVCNVRPDGSRPSGFQLYDDEGGFPAVNRMYGELSALRKLQHDRPAERVGLVHYRRLFTARRGLGHRDDRLGLRTLGHFNWGSPDRFGCGATQLGTAVEGSDWATPEPIDICGPSWRNLHEQFAAFHDPRPLDLAADVVDREFGDSGAFMHHLRSRRTMRPFNMFIGRADILDSYANSLWRILDEVAGDYEAGLSGYQARWPGFLAERIHSYWAEEIAPARRLRVAALPIVLLEDCLVEDETGGRQIYGRKDARVWLRRRYARVRPFGP